MQLSLLLGFALLTVAKPIAGPDQNRNTCTKTVTVQRQCPTITVTAMNPGPTTTVTVTQIVTPETTKTTTSSSILTTESTTSFYTTTPSCVSSIPSPTVIAGRTCVVTKNIDRPGGDIPGKSKYTGNFDDCLAYCASLSSCVTAQYSKQNGYCYVKNDKNPAVANCDNDSADCSSVVTTTPSTQPSTPSKTTTSASTTASTTSQTTPQTTSAGITSTTTMSAVTTASSTTTTVSTTTVSFTTPITPSTTTPSTMTTSSTTSSTTSPSTIAAATTTISSTTSTANPTCAIATGVYIFRASGTGDPAVDGNFAQLRQGVGNSYTVQFDAKRQNAQQFRIQCDFTLTTSDGGLVAMVGGSDAALYSQYFFSSIASAKASFDDNWEVNECFRYVDGTLLCGVKNVSIFQVSRGDTRLLIGDQNYGEELKINMILVPG